MNSMRSIKRHVGFVGLILIFLGNSLHSQHPKEEGLPFITNYNYVEYGANAGNWGACEDDRGIMYFANYEGILQYDGANWRLIRHPDNYAGRSVLKGSDGVIYVSWDGDLGYLAPDDSGTLEFVSIKDKLPKDERVLQEVWFCYESDKGIWYQTSNRLFLWSDGQFKIWRSEDGFHQSAFVHGKHYARIWNIGLTVMENGTFNLVHGGEMFADERIYVILPYDEDKVLLGTRTKGLFIYDGKTFAPFETEADQYIKNTSLYGGTVLPDGKFALVCINNATVIIDRQGRLIQRIDRSTELQDNNVTDAFYDSRGILWMSLTRGISTIDLNMPFSQFNGEKSGLLPRITYSVGRYDGSIYAGTTDGVYRLNGQTGKFQLVEGTRGQCYTFVQKGGELLVGTSDMGVVGIRGDKSYEVRTSVNYDYRCNGIYPSKIDTTVIYAVLEGGLSVLRYKPGSSKTSNWVEESFVEDVIVNLNVGGIQEDGQGRLWLLSGEPGEVQVLTPTYVNGRVSLPDSDIRTYTTADGLPDFTISVFNFDGKMYFGTSVEGKFYLYDDAKDRFFLDPDMPLMNFVGDGGGFSGVPGTDAYGWLWADLGKGLFAIKPDGAGQYQVVKSIFKLFQANDTYSVYTERTAEGDAVVWMTGPEGVLRYEGPLEEAEPEEYHALIRSIKIRSDSLLYGGYGDVLENQSFAFSSNTVVFSYAAPFFTDEATMQFATYLEGFENHWSDWSKQSEREYINLPAGDYTFKVKGLNVYGHESTVARYSFSITPPWYASWIAYMAYLVIGLSLIYSFIRWRTGRLHMRSLELELEVEHRTEEIQRRVEELGVINTVQEGLVEQNNMKAIYALVGDKIREVFDSQVVVINTFDAEAGQEYYRYAFEKGELFNIEAPQPIDPLRKHIIDSGQMILINKNYLEECAIYGGNPVTAGEVPKSALWMPLTVRDQVIGTVSLQNVDHENAFKDSDVKLLGTLTNSMAVALENARLFEESTRLLDEVQLQAQELAVINSIQTALVEQSDTEAIYTLMGEKIRERFGSQAIVINTFDHNADLNYYRYVFEKGKRLDVTEPVPLNNIMKKLIETDEPVIFNENYAALREEYGLGEVVVGNQPKSAIWVPITAKDVVIGSISLQDIDRENAFSEADIQLLEALTVSMSIALGKTRLFEEAEQRAAEMSTVNKISQALTKHLELNQLVQLVGENMRDLFNADIAYVALLQKERGVIEFPYQYGDDLQPLKLGEGITSQIISGNKAKLINHGVSEAHKEMGIVMVGKLPESYLGVPIPVGDEVIGVISVQRTSSKNHFDPSDMHLLETIASNIGIAIHNAQLFQEAEASRAIAEDANEAKSAFLSTVSHELRTPLTSVMGFAKITKRRLEERIFPVINTDDPKMQRTIKQISDNLNVVVSEGERLTKLINNVLDLAKIEAGRVEWHMENLQISGVIERAIAATTSLFEHKGLKLKKSITSKLSDVNADEDKIIQVVVNLLSNAVKFTEEGEILCIVEEKDGDIIISVKDSGIGIAKEDLPKVFEKFRQVGDTLTDKPTGTGLGLPISKEIVEHHGGRIWLKSEVGVGSTFFFSLPVSGLKSTSLKTFKLDELVDQLEGNYAENQFDNAAEKTILVVDDEAPIRELLNQELSGKGFNVIEAVDGMEGIEKVRHKHPDLILLDVMMPEMNGYDVAAVLKNDPKTKDIPIIILSVVKDKERGLSIGIDRYLFKPINTDLLFKEIGSLLGQGRSKRKVMILDEDSTTVNTLMGVLQDKGYNVVEANGPDLVQKAILGKPDIIIVNSTLAEDQETVKALRMEKGMENVLFLVYE